MRRLPSLFGFTIAALIGIAAPSYAQQPAPPPTSTSGTQTASPASSSAAPAAAPPVITVTPTTVTTPASDDAKNPSPDIVKKAKQAGYRAKLRKGKTVFCKEETEIGSHFSSENCINEEQLTLALDRQQAQRDQLTNHTCTGCSGK
jgi:hypothetical protein